MNLLIIGGTGVLSGAVAREAIKQDIHVSILHRGTKPQMIPSGVESIIADAKDQQKVDSVLKGRMFDSLIDFICYTKAQLEASYSIFSRYTRQYVFISTACVYDNSIPGVKHEDSPKILCSWNYSKEKWECEQYLKNVSKESGIPYTVIRPAVTYDNSRIPYGITPVYGYHWTLIGRALANKPIIIWDNGKARWNLMRVEDFAIGVIGIIGNSKAYNQEYNISGDEGYSWLEVLDALSKAINHPVKTFNMTSQEYCSLYPSRAGEISGRANDLIIDNSKIKTISPQFSTKISLERGIKMTVDHYKSNQYLKGIDYRYDGMMDSMILKSSIQDMNLSFVDYLGTATFHDKLCYYSSRHDLWIVSKIAKAILKTYK